jgi:twitching motility protein PilT
MEQETATPPEGVAQQDNPFVAAAPAPAANLTPPAGVNVTPVPGNEPPLKGRRLLDRIVQLIAAKNGSDIHLMEGDAPRVRLHGDLLPLESKEHPVITREDIVEIMEQALTPEQKEIFEKYSDIDFSLEFDNATGRVNVGYANARKMHLVMRYLRADIIPIDKIGLDVGMLKKMCDHGMGVIMVAGETSSGKTTTITAMLDYINHMRFGSIQTIENPVEYSMTSNKCLITRREIGRDTPDFHSALRASVRKNPDVLLIGEVRDPETANIALTAAETGIQTFCTIHAIGAIPAITRLRNILAGGEKSASEFYQRLSHCLAGIISQQLIKASDGSGVLPVYEILNMGYAEKNYLRDGDFERLEHSLETDHNISMGSCVYRLWHSVPKRIDENTIRSLYHDQFRLIMNRLEDAKGWKPMGTGI